MEIPEHAKILNSLGLTFNEARVFLALSQLGAATAKAISNSSGLGREVVYQIMPKLLEKGLVEEAVTSPKSFRAVPLKEAYAILLQRKEEENRELYKKAMEAFKRHQSKSALKVEDSEIILVSAGGGDSTSELVRNTKKFRKV